MNDELNVERSAFRNGEEPLRTPACLRRSHSVVGRTFYKQKQNTHVWGGLVVTNGLRMSETGTRRARSIRSLTGAC